MRLRTRLLLGFTIVFAVVVAAGVFTVVAQRNRLYDQVDDQLMSTPLPPALRAERDGGTGPPGRPEPGPVDNESISDLYIAVVTPDGTLRSQIEGQLLEDTPNVEAFVESPPSETMLFSTGGVNGVSTFRVQFRPGTENSLPTFMAIPVDDIQDTIRQLTLTLAGVAALLLVVLTVIASWVNRFGLRPISAMTDIAEAISSGDRDRRTAVDAESTESGRLGHALNVMLDERDKSNARLRKFVSNASHE